MIAVGCDHGGYELKKEILAYLEKHGLSGRDPSPPPLGEQ